MKLVDKEYVPEEVVFRYQKISYYLRSSEK